MFHGLVSEKGKGKEILGWTRIKGPTFSVYKCLYTVITISVSFYFARGSKRFTGHFSQSYKVFFMNPAQTPTGQVKCLSI
jgi:hypothetical protein